MYNQHHLVSPFLGFLEVSETDTEIFSCEHIFLIKLVLPAPEGADTTQRFLNISLLKLIIL